MDFHTYHTATPSMVDFDGRYRADSNKIPWSFLFLYLFLAGVLVYIYHVKVVGPADWNAANSITAVRSFETVRPYQFRLLIPLFFPTATASAQIFGKYLYSAYNMIIIFSLLVVYCKMLCVYFKNKKLLLWLTPVILYLILFNFILLNDSFQYYDFTAILLFTAGLYYIVKRRFVPFLIIFIIGIVNKETAGYLIFSYLLFNYKEIFTKEIIFRTALLGLMFIGYKLFLNYIFQNNPGSNYEVAFGENRRIISVLFSDMVFLRHILFNFGGLYVFAILLFVTGAWKKFPVRRLVMVNLTIVPYYIIGIYVTYITEVRVYTELIPMITTLFLIYLSNFKRLNLQPVNK